MDYKDNIILYVASSKHDEQMKLFTEDPVSILDDAFVHLFGSFLHLHLLNIVRKEAALSMPVIVGTVPIKSRPGLLFPIQCDNTNMQV